MTFYPFPQMYLFQALGMALWQEMLCPTAPIFEDQE